MNNGDKEAFPLAFYDDQRGVSGLSKREWFAGMALAGLLANSHSAIVFNQFPLTKIAIDAADDIIKTLEQ